MDVHVVARQTAFLGPATATGHIAAVEHQFAGANQRGVEMGQSLLLTYVPEQCCPGGGGGSRIMLVHLCCYTYYIGNQSFKSGHCVIGLPSCIDE